MRVAHRIEQIFFPMYTARLNDYPSAHLQICRQMKQSKTTTRRDIKYCK